VTGGAPTTRVALYARYSHDLQRDASIEDQFRICRDQAKREDWRIVGTYKDTAISGASVILRPGIQTLVQDVQRGEFDIVLAEALDRSAATRPTSPPCSSISASQA
jgi:DNA invertase Pin-like site-specific DNA recombinase